ncbi:MAG: hypothetical protein KAU23_11415 [Anaerolineales bacterium]|nr:hypothetical protein [Anaerolineales bacterium]
MQLIGTFLPGFVVLEGNQANLEIAIVNLFNAANRETAVLSGWYLTRAIYY